MTASVRALFPAGATVTTTGAGVTTITTSVTIVAGDVLEVHTVLNSAADGGMTLAPKLDPTGANLSPDGQSAIVHSNNQAAGFEQVFYYLNPPVGTFNVTTTQAGGAVDGMEQKCLTITGTTKTAPTITTFAPAGTGTGTAVTITAPSFFRGVVTGHFCTGSAFSSTGQTQLYIGQNVSVTNAANAIAGNVTPGTGGNVTLTATVSAADWWAAVAFSWNAPDEPVWSHWRQTPPGVQSPGAGKFIPGLRGPAPEVISKLDLRTNNADASTYASNIFTPSPGKLLFVMAHGTGSQATDSTLTASANGITFTKVSDMLQVLSGNVSAWFVADQLTPASPIPMTVTWDCTSDPSTGAFLAVAEVDEITRTGTAAIKQTALNANIAANGAYTATFGTAVNPANPVLGMVGYNGALSITEPPQWFEIDEPPDMTLPAQGFEWAKRDYGETGTAMAWTASAATVRANVGAVEFDMSPPSGGGLTSVTSTRATSWDTLAPVTSSRATSWTTQASVASTRATSWNVLASVASTRATTWNTLAAVLSTRATTWNTRAAITSTRATTWNTAASVVSTRATTWNVAASVLSTRATTWNTLEPITATRATTWNVLTSLTSVTSTRATTWNVLASVLSTRATTWNVAASVSSTRATTWNTLASVSSTRATTWNTRAAVLSTRATTWNTLAAVTATRATTWNTRAAVLSSRATTWNTLASVASTRATTWNVAANLVSVTSTRATTWNVTGQVTSTRATLWTTRAPVTATRAATWSVLTTTSSSRATTWATLALVVSTRATSWRTLAAVLSTRATQWNVLSDVIQGVPVANPILTLTTTDSTLTLATVAAGVLTVTDHPGVLVLTDDPPPTLTVNQPAADLTLN